MSIKARSFLIKALAGLALVFLATGCLPSGDRFEDSQVALATPTMNPAFYAGTGSTSTMAVIAPDQQDTLEAPPSQPIIAAIAPSVTPAVYRKLVIYDESLDENWILEHSNQVNYNLKDTMVAHNGTFALSFTPMASFSSLFFTVREGAQQAYPRDQVAGVSFWLYSGNDNVKTSDLAVTVVGSNQYPYWVLDDNSVNSSLSPKFSETRLYDLDINYDIPSNTWVQIDVWLDKLHFDPDYKYVTGFLIKNDKGFYNTVFIDQVELLLTAATR
jgi:hypothetical protein